MAEYPNHATHADGPWGSRPYRDVEAYEMAVENAGRLTNVESDMSDMKLALNYPAGTITWFGWRKPVNSSNPEGEPVGNLLRLARMQSILKLGGYMVKNDHSRKKLSPSDHRFYEDGSEVVFTGAHGHYHWGSGVEMWYGSWIEDGFEYEVFDDRIIPGHPCVKIPIFSVSAAGRCAIDRTNLQLVDYISEDARYRGGNNEASWDGTFRSLLGMPVSNIAIGTLAGYARKNGNLWFANERVAIFIVGALMRVFFHNANIQADFVEGVDERGLHRGGLGVGIYYDDGVIQWSSQRGYNPYWKNSVGIEKGDFTGLISTTITNSSGNSVTVSGIPCFMGLKNWYKSLWVMEEDSLLVCNSNKTQSMYVKKVIDGTAPSLSGTSDMVLAATCPAHGSGSWSAIKQTTKAYLSGAPIVDGGTNDTFMCDGYYNPAVTDGSVRGSFRLGFVNDGSNAGSCLLNGSVVPSHTDAYRGAVLCEFTEAFDTELTVPAEE